MNYFIKENFTIMSWFGMDVKEIKKLSFHRSQCEINSGDIIQLIGVKYSVQSIRVSIEDKYILIRPINIKSTPDKTITEDEITCPYCDAAIGDSWEMSDEDNALDCENCNSVFSYVREIEVSYRCRPVKRNDDVKVLD